MASKPGTDDIIPRGRAAGHPEETGGDAGRSVGQDVRAYIGRVADVTPALSDAAGPIPSFPPRALDSRGRLIPIPPEERQARVEAAIRALKAIESLPDYDPPGTAERMMRGIDENRPAGAKLFEGLY